MFCPKCGKELKEGGSFCPQCGTAVSRPSGIGSYKKISHDIPPVSGNSSSKIPLFLVAGAGFVVLLAVGLGVMFYVQSNTKEMESVGVGTAEIVNDGQPQQSGQETEAEKATEAEVEDQTKG